jgi:hypothetical protein
MAAKTRRHTCTGANARTEMPRNRLPGMMLGQALRANAIQQHRVAFHGEAIIFGDFMLAFFDVGIGELDHLAAIGTNEVIVVVAIVQFEYRLAAVELAAYQYAGLFELGQYTVNRSQADIDIFVDEGAIDIFGALMALICFAKNIEDLEARKCRLEPHVF